MAEGVQHVCHILSFITSKKYRSLHLLDFISIYLYIYMPQQSGHLEDLSSGLWWYCDIW